MIDPRVWLRTAESRIPVAVRTARRAVARTHARMRSGSIEAHLERVVASAGSTTATPPSPATSSTATSSTATSSTATSTPSPTPRSTPLVVEVSTYPLHPRQTGGQLRGWYLAEALAAPGDIEVEIISLTTEPALAGRFELAAGVHETCVLLDESHARRETALRLLAGPISITDIAAGLMWTGIEEFVTAVRSTAERATAAVLIQPYLVDAVMTLAPRVPLVYDAHNDEVVLKRTMMPPTRAGTWLLERIDEIERVASEQAALITATTDVDLDSLARRYHVTEWNAVVPNGVDTAAIAFVIGDEREAARAAVTSMITSTGEGPLALFVGSGHRPNIDAGRAIATLAVQMPSVDFILAGDHSDHIDDGHAPPNLHALGHVDDTQLTRLLAGCTVALNPMAVGAGSNLKLFTFLAAGLPVVSTVIGARGIDAEQAGIFAVEMADLPDELARVIHRDNSAEVRRGRSYVEEHSDWASIGRRFRTLVSDHVLT